MSSSDPYAKYGGAVAADPYSKYGGKVAAPAPAAMPAAMPAAPVDPNRDLGPWELIPQTMATLRDQLVPAGKRFVQGAGEFFGRFDENPIGTAYDVAKGIVTSPLRAYEHFKEFKQGAESGNPEDLSKGTVGFIEEIPNLMGLKGGFGAVKKGVADLSFKPDPVSTWVRAFKPGKTAPDFAQAEVGTAEIVLKEIKAFEDVTGRKVDSPQLVREAMKTRSKHYNQYVNRLLNPRRDIVVPDSGAAIADAKIAAIPESIRLQDPVEYTRLTAKANTARGKHFTVGELNDIRQGTGAKASRQYDKNVKAALVLDENIAAMDKAAADTSRNLLYEHVNQVSPRAGSAFREANSRIGATIEQQDLAEGLVNASIAQKKSVPAKVASGVSKALSPVKSLEKLSTGESATIVGDIASAVKRWKKRPDILPEFPLQGTHGTKPQLMLSAHAGGWEMSPADLPTAVQDTASRSSAMAPATREIRTGRLIPAQTGAVEMPPIDIPTAVQDTAGRSSAAAPATREIRTGRTLPAHAGAWEMLPIDLSTFPQDTAVTSTGAANTRIQGDKVARRDPYAAVPGAKPSKVPKIPPPGPAIVYDTDGFGNRVPVVSKNPSTAQPIPSPKTRIVYDSDGFGGQIPVAIIDVATGKIVRNLRKNQ